jgi:DNA-directed RNA polymerase subunit L
MQLRVIDKTDEELRIEIAGEDHTFMNVLKGQLLNTDGVAAATYDMNPEQSGGQTQPILSIKTEDGLDPLDALGEGAAGISDNLADLYDRIEAAFDDAAAAEA